ncbi:MAG TPA: hypothetical protein V6D28_12590 [Leptolyngbyaceae cyanobacterium]
MKKVIFGTVSVLFMSAFATSAAFAQTPTTAPSTTTDRATTSTYMVEPFNLAWMAYQGYFEAQGIPGGEALTTAFKAGDIDASDLVESAIKTNRLPAGFNPDNTYLSWVEMTLGNIDAR